MTINIQLNKYHISCHVIPEVSDVVSGFDDGDVDVGSGAHVVDDAGGDGVADQLLGVLLRHARLPTRLKDSHGCKKNQLISKTVFSERSFRAFCFKNICKAAWKRFMKTS